MDTGGRIYPARNLDILREILELNSLSYPKVYQQFFWCYRHGRILHSDILLSIPIVPITIYCEICQIQKALTCRCKEPNFLQVFVDTDFCQQSTVHISLGCLFCVPQTQEQQRQQCWCRMCEQFGTGLKSLVGFVRASEKLEVNTHLQAQEVLITICHKQCYVFAFLSQLCLMQEKCPMETPAYFFFQMSACMSACLSAGQVLFLVNRIHLPDRAVAVNLAQVFIRRSFPGLSLEYVLSYTDLLLTDLNLLRTVWKSPGSHSCYSCVISRNSH